MQTFQTMMMPTASEMATFRQKQGGPAPGQQAKEVSQELLEANTNTLNSLKEQIMETLAKRSALVEKTSAGDGDIQAQEIRRCIHNLGTLFNTLGLAPTSKRDPSLRIEDEEVMKMCSQPPSQNSSPVLEIPPISFSEAVEKVSSAKIEPVQRPLPKSVQKEMNPDQHAERRLSKRQGSTKQSRRQRPASFKSPLHKRLDKTGTEGNRANIPSLKEGEKKSIKENSDKIKKAVNDAKNPVTASQSDLGDMYHVLREREVKFQTSDIMKLQPQVNAQMRSILVDWIIDVCHEFRHTDDTLHLAVKLVDRLLSIVAVPRKELQLVGCAAILLAAKLEEVLSVRLDDLLYLCDHQYTRDELLQMESVLLEKLSYKFSCPTAMSFMQWIWKTFDFCPKTHHRSHFLLELSLENVEMMQMLPSKLATTAACLALMNASKPYESLLEATGYTETEIRVVSKQLAHLCTKQQDIWKSNTGQDDQLLQTTYDKFASPKREEVSKEKLLKY